MTSPLLRLPKVLQKCAKSRAGFYVLVSEGLWPKPVSIGRRCVAWPENEVDAMNAARIAGWNDEQIRVLVQQLEASRRKLNPNLIAEPI